MIRNFSRRRFFRLALATGISLSIGGLVVRGQRPEAPVQPGQEMKPIIAPAVKQTQRAKRIRDGTPFKDKNVYFRETGGRMVLNTVEDNQRFTCLENLQLERIIIAIQEKPGREYWKIEGEFTEFRGENYVLIRRAQVAAAPSGQRTP